jgi:hypothetical protein
MAEFRDKAHFEGAEAIKETAMALLCEIDGKQVWIPKSQIDDDSEVWEEGQSGELIINEWLAKEKGLI